MPKAVSTREAKNTLSALIGWAREHGDEVIVENHGEPSAVIMAYDEYETLRALKERQRRADALATLQRLQAEVSARNQDLSEEQIAEIAERAGRDVIEGLIAKGKIRFE